MKSRMSKYETPLNNQRTKRNESLYKRISNEELSEFTLNSNVKVLGDHSKGLNVEQIREMLDMKYREEPKRKSVNLEQFPERKEPKEVVPEETKEYDINTILQKARSEKVSNYETERLKKLRDTQYDILKNLELTSEEIKEEKSEEEQKLLNLINTITEKEFLKQEKEEEVVEELDPLDILSDLKGTEHTAVFEPIIPPKEENKTDEATKKIKKVIEEEVQNQIDKSFFTTSTQFTQSDFDDFNDLKQDVKSSKILIKVLIALILIILTIGILFLFNIFLNLGWFS